MASTDGEISVDEAIEQIGFGRFQILLVIVCGVLQAVDAIEMLLLSVLGPAASCEWYLTTQQVALITTAVFVGMLIGCPLWGALADRKGRWTVLLMTSSFITYFGLLSALSPTYTWLVLLRGLVGFGMAGVAASSSCLFSEFMTRGARAPGMVLSSAFWSVGGLIMAGLAYAIVPKYGWRWLAAIAAVPLLIATIVFAWLPQSPRYLLLLRRPEKAKEVINRIARINGKPEITSNLHAEHVVRGTCPQLFHPRYWRGTLQLWFLWFGCGFMYYGVVLTAAEIPITSHWCLQNPSKFSSRAGMSLNDDSCCQALSDQSYIGLIVSSVGEFLSIPFNALMLELIGRRPVMASACSFAAIAFFCLNFCAPPQIVNAFLFIARAGCQSVFAAAYVYTTEYYPTSVRVLGMGCASAAARIGAMVTPFVAQVLLPSHSVFAATSIYSATLVAMAVCAALLPVETKGRPMPQTVDDEPETEKLKKASEGSSYGALPAK